MSDLKQHIKAGALRLGFSQCGMARNDSLEELRPFYTAFIQRNGHAGLEYLKTNFEKRLHPELVLSGTKTVIAVLLNYFPPVLIPAENNYIISKYAYGNDYQRVMKKRMQGLTTLLKQSAEGVEARAFVDSGAVLEKAWAQKCGVGWQGKNTLIINRESGSFHFIGIILTTLELEPDPPETDHCGGCNACMKACPTGALETPYQLNIARCISYLTIETREEIPEPLKSGTGNHLYGCDICQDVCPYNRFARPHQIPEFLPPEELMQMRKNDWNSMTESDFNRIFENSPLKRWGYHRLQRGLL